MTNETKNNEFRTMSDLYFHMKEVLKYFELHFSQMDKVKFSVEGDEVIFQYKYKTVYLSQLEDND